MCRPDAQAETAMSFKREIQKVLSGRSPQLKPAIAALTRHERHIIADVAAKSALTVPSMETPQSQGPAKNIALRAF